MTYKESLEIAFRYADSEESDFDYKDMFWSLADEAQKLIATNGDKIMKECEVVADLTTPQSPDGDSSPYTREPLSASGYKLKLPEDLYEVRSIIDAYGNSVTFDIRERGTAIVPATGTYKVTYYALPQTINENTPEDYEYEVPLYTHAAIPYYIAYRLVGTDDTTLYTALKNQWDLYMSIFNQTGKAKHKQIKNVYARW